MSIADTALKFSLKYFKSIMSNTNLRNFDPTQGADLLAQIADLKSVGVFMEPNDLLNAYGRKANIVKAIKEMYGFDMSQVNSTLFKSFAEVETAHQFDMFMAHQQAHYESTYGTNFEGEMYEPNRLDTEKLAEMKREISKFTHIHVVDKNEMTDDVNRLLQSGIALPSEEITALVELVRYFRLKLDIANLTNKELKCQLVAYTEGSNIPHDFEELMRAVFYVVTGNTLLIKNKETLAQFVALDEKTAEAVYNLIRQYNLKINDGYLKLTESIQRYKKYILLVRKALTKRYHISYINQLLRDAKVNHKPRFIPVLNRVADPTVSLEEVIEAAKHAPTQTIIRAIESLYLKLDYTRGGGPRVFKVRNGKTFIKNSESQSDPSMSVFNDRMRIVGDKMHALQSIVIERIKPRLSKYKAVYMPIDYKVPLSAKSFFNGLVPEFSSMRINGDLIIGVSWNEDIDIDLHAYNGEVQYGWNGLRQGEGVYYSGDMTKTNNHGFAAEVFKLKADEVRKPLVVSINPYYMRQSESSDVSIVLAGGTNDPVSFFSSVTSAEGPMVAFKDIKYMGKMDITPTKGATIGVVVPIQGGFEVIFANAKGAVGDHVPYVGGVSEDLISATIRKARSRMSLDYLFIYANMEDVIYTDREAFEARLEKSNIPLSPDQLAWVQKNFNIDSLPTALSDDEVLDLSLEKLSATTLIDLLYGE